MPEVYQDKILKAKVDDNIMYFLMIEGCFWLWSWSLCTNNMIYVAFLGMKRGLMM